MRPTPDNNLYSAFNAARTDLLRLDVSFGRILAEAGLVWFVACGSTALGVQAALADIDRPDVCVLDNVAAFECHLRLATRQPLVIGMSVSGLSMEVRAVLRRAVAQGLSTVYVTRGASLEGTTHHVALRFEAVPQRILPVAVYGFVVGILSRKPFEVGEPLLPAVLPAPYTDLSAFLAEAHTKGLVPVVASADRPFLGRLLATQYMEFLKKPAIHVRFPEWTHHLLWTLDPPHQEQFAFVHIRPVVALEDGRFDNLVEHLTVRRFRQFIFEDFGAARCNAGGQTLMEVLSLYRSLATHLSIDPDTEASFVL